MSKYIHDADHWIHFWRDMSDDAVRAMLRVAAVLAAYMLLRWILFRLIDGLMRRLASLDAHTPGVDHSSRLVTLRGLCKSVVGYTLLFLFGVLLFKAVGFDVLPFVTTAGVIGLAIGFGSQKLVKDVISGFFIIVDNLFVVGETITACGVTGEVQELGMRVTRLHDVSGRVHQLANGDIGTITNHSRYPVEDFVDVSVAAGADLAEASRAIETAGAELFAAEGGPLQAAPRVIGITAFTAASTTLRISVVAAPRSLAQAQIDVRTAMRAALLKSGIALAP
jgi:small conductance mechanosensitive channel